MITKGLAQSAIQQAVFALLASDLSLQALVGTRIYDAVPDSITDDYIAIGEWDESSDDTLEDGDAGVGSDVSFTIHAYTDDSKGAAGYKKVQAIADRVKILLHTAALNVTGWALVTCEHEETVTMRDVDEGGRPKRHCVSTYSVLVEAS